ncbi:MAG TPA: hypothetical protein VF875_09870 [Anaeromyxobacter sp.]
MSTLRAIVTLAFACCAVLAPGCATTDTRVAGEQVQPPGPPPGALPPPPPDQPAPADGQWVFTQQYGWVWMPYGDAYTYVPPGNTGEPLEFVFYGAYGWTWVSAPWVWGYGASPWFGRPGPRHYAWYQHGWWRSPRRWRYVPQAHADRHVMRPAPERQGRAPPPREGRDGGERARPPSR